MHIYYMLKSSVERSGHKEKEEEEKPILFAIKEKIINGPTSQ